MSLQLRLVLDTNVVLSALLWRGRPAELLDLVETSEIQLFTSDWLVAELHSTLLKPKLKKRLGEMVQTPAQLVANYRSVATVLLVPPLLTQVSRDPDDDNVLACALSAGATAIVTGDDDLLALGAWQGIGILSVRDCLEVALTK